jgi:hypothetical protein
MSDHHAVRHTDPASLTAAAPEPARERRSPAEPAQDTQLAVAIRELVQSGEMDEARRRFAGLVARHQRRASRIAYCTPRRGEADEAVQDASSRFSGTSPRIAKRGRSKSGSPASSSMDA